MKNPKTFLSKSYILISFLMLIASNCFSQWKTAESNNIKGDIIISYEVIYDRELSLEEKKSKEYISQIVVSFNKDKLIEHSFGYKHQISPIFRLFYFDTMKFYACSVRENKKRAIEYNLIDRIPAIKPLPNSEPKMFFGFPCEKGIVMINKIPYDVYYTKKIGLKYSRPFEVNGFTMQYPGNCIIGHYTVKAKKIVYKDLPDSFYSLDGFNIQTVEEAFTKTSTRKQGKS